MPALLETARGQAAAMEIRRPLDVQEFCNKWGLKRSEVALLLDVPQDTLRHWVSEKSSRQESADILKTLDRLDFLLRVMLLADEEIPEVIAIYLVAKQRGRGTAFKDQKNS